MSNNTDNRKFIVRFLFALMTKLCLLHLHKQLSPLLYLCSAVVVVVFVVVFFFFFRVFFFFSSSLQHLAFRSQLMSNNTDNRKSIVRFLFALMTKLYLLHLHKQLSPLLYLCSGVLMFFPCFFLFFFPSSLQHLASRSQLVSNNTNNREFIERFRGLRALHNLRKNMQHVNTNQQISGI